jgi:hypothetical protein
MGSVYEVGGDAPPPPGIRNLYIILLTPWSRILLEKLIGTQLVKKFLAFYGTRRFFTVFTRARH